MNDRRVLMTQKDVLQAGGKMLTSSSTEPFKELYIRLDFHASDTIYFIACALNGTSPTVYNDYDEATPYLTLDGGYNYNFFTNSGYTSMYNIQFKCGINYNTLEGPVLTISKYEYPSSGIYYTRIGKYISYRYYEEWAEEYDPDGGIGSSISTNIYIVGFRKNNGSGDLYSRATDDFLIKDDKGNYFYQRFVPNNFTWIKALNANGTSVVNQISQQWPYFKYYSGTIPSNMIYYIPA